MLHTTQRSERINPDVRDYLFWRFIDKLAKFRSDCYLFATQVQLHQSICESRKAKLIFGQNMS